MKGLKMRTIIFATGNMGKLREVKQIMEGLPYEIISMKEAGVEVDVDETGTTFEENAILKAKAVAEKTKEEGKYADALVMADDSGFEVDYLGGKPGIYSARFMGTDTPYSIKNQKILDEMKGVPDELRAARFVAAISVVFPDGTCKVVKDTFEGKVAYEAKGQYAHSRRASFSAKCFNCCVCSLITMEAKQNIKKGEEKNGSNY